MKIFFVVFLFLFVVVYSTDISISRTYNDLNSYAFYISLEDTAKDTAKSLNPYYYENLEVHYSSLTSEEVQNLQNKYYLTLNIFKVFSFLLFNGIFLMTLNSFYRRQMLLD
ncbi:MAG: hypothetical protein LBC61_00420 [Candidatus Peribacteria bacterium]|jgi:Ser-tRNA(Ala) deacylase AlaX|nr:hypothetical protein [Candidatus Peribacteria bacterium]